MNAMLYFIREWVFYAMCSPNGIILNKQDAKELQASMEAGGPMHPCAN
jgi:hypothetical protein